MPLTELQIKRLAVREGRYAVSDGRGLALEMMPTGAASWRYQPPPPASALNSSRAQNSLNKAKSLIQGVHGSLPSDSAVSSAPGLNIGHSAE